MRDISLGFRPIEEKKPDQEECDVSASRVGESQLYKLMIVRR